MLLKVNISEDSGDAMVVKVPSCWSLVIQELRSVLSRLLHLTLSLAVGQTDNVLPGSCSGSGIPHIFKTITEVDEL